MGVPAAPPLETTKLVDRIRQFSKKALLTLGIPGGRSTVSKMLPEPRQWTHPKVYRVNLGTRGNCQPGPQPLATAAEIPASQPVTRTAFSLRVVQAVLHWSPWLRILALDGVCASSGFISGARSAPTSATTAKNSPLPAAMLPVGNGRADGPPANPG